MRRSRKHCKPCAKHAHAPPPRARTRLHKFHSVGNSNQHLPVQCNNELNRQRDGAGETSRTRQITSCLRRDGQHARRSHKHCKPCAGHAHDTQVRARTRVHKFHSVGNSNQPGPGPLKQRLENNNVTAPLKPQQTTNYELLKKDWATRAPVAQTLQSVRHTCSRTITTCAYTFVQVPLSGTFKPTRTSPSETTT